LTNIIPTQLAAHERTIERGMTTFVDVGRALAAIRDGRLYRESHATFEEYCKTRWGWSKRHCDRLIGAAEVANEVGPIGPTTESQARPLKKLPPEEQAPAWQEAQAVAAERGQKVTAAVPPDMVLSPVAVPSRTWTDQRPTWC
jgi:hypothetical protein